MSDQFLKNIHKKIQIKQKINYGLTFVFSFSLMIMMTFKSMKIINNSKLNLDWQQYELLEFAEETYEWDIKPELSEEEIYQYLLEEMDVIHFIEELTEEEQEIVINKVKMENEPIRTRARNFRQISSKQAVFR